MMSPAPAPPAPLLHIRKLAIDFDTYAAPANVVDGISLIVPHGGAVALVGESGCGKSVTAMSILRLLPTPPARIRTGEILFADSDRGHPVDLLTLADRPLRAIRGGRIGMIFQEPMTALNPVYSAGEQIAETMLAHRGVTPAAARAESVGLLKEVGIHDPERCFDAYPHELSGGMRQRVMIAIALANTPALLIADEPTTALDVTLQRQVLSLLGDLRRRRRMGLLLITHDFGVVAAAAEYVYVMYAGRIVEAGPVRAVLQSPRHPYTRGLLACVPRLSQKGRKVSAIPGTVPPAGRRPAGCAFHPRCELSAQRAERPDRESLGITGEWTGRALRRCVEVYPGERSGVPALHAAAADHHVACWEVEPHPAPRAISIDLAAS